MMKSNTIRTYTTPETSVFLIEQEHNFTATTNGPTLGGMNANEVYDEDF